MNTIYVLSGLGIDQRVFGNIDFGESNVIFIDWKEPLKNESIESYAERIAQSITTEAPILIGLSFGGILGIEIAKIRPVRKLILISSAKTRNELPLLFRLAGKLKLNKFFPNTILKHKNFITSWLFGIESTSDGELFRKILKDVDPKFLSWAVNAVLNWQNNYIPKNCFHIHGSKDRILPVKNMQTDIIIKDGGHFMTVNRSVELSEIIRKICR